MNLFGGFRSETRFDLPGGRIFVLFHTVKEGVKFDMKLRAHMGSFPVEHQSHSFPMVLGHS